jgi:hypothetical protein
VRLKGLGKLGKKCKDVIGNLPRDLPSFNIVPTKQFLTVSDILVLAFHSVYLR